MVAIIVYCCIDTNGFLSCNRRVGAPKHTKHTNTTIRKRNEQHTAWNDEKPKASRRAARARTNGMGAQLGLVRSEQAFCCECALNCVLVRLWSMTIRWKDLIMPYTSTYYSTSIHTILMGVPNYLPEENSRRAMTCASTSATSTSTTDTTDLL